MHFWQVAFDPKLDAPQFIAEKGFGHALLSTTVVYALTVLRVGGSIWEHGQDWLPIHDEQSILEFELEHGIEGRSVTNWKRLEQAIEQKRTVVSEFAGYTDLFVPILARDQVVAVLVVGPVARSRATAREILERWRFLTGREGHPEDPEFPAAYLTATFGTLVLDGNQFPELERMLECIAALLGGEGDAGSTASEAQRILKRLEPTRFVDHVWESVRTMVDDRYSRSWFTSHRAAGLRRLGLSREIDHVLAGIVTSPTSVDAVEDIVRRDAFQREAVSLAQKTGNVVAGQLGHHGVVFLSGTSASAAQKRRRLEALADQVATLGRRDFGFGLHFGLSAVDESALSVAHQNAIAAAESALGRGQRLVVAETRAATTTHSLRKLRDELALLGDERPEPALARAQRYLEAVIVHSGYRVEAARVHLEVGFDRIAESLEKAGRLNRRELDLSLARLNRAANSANNLSELRSAYERAAVELSRALEEPVAARQVQNLKRATEYIKEHYSERLRLDKVAKIAGFAPGHFSKLFVRQEKMPFEQYVRSLRLERAKHLLLNSELDATRVAELSGFANLQYFCRVFRDALDMTPLQYRKLRPPKGHVPAPATTARLRKPSRRARPHDPRRRRGPIA